MIEINIDATALGSSGCILKLLRTVVGEVSDPSKGGYKELTGAAAIYGVAVHKFVDTMYKTGGHYPSARVEAEKVFALPKIVDSKKAYLSDPKHLITTCFNLWSTYIENESTFDIINVNQECWWCGGSGIEDSKSPTLSDLRTHLTCSRCKGKTTIEGPATELTFRIPYFEDEIVKIYLCGTIDKVGKFKGGCYAIGDWKTTSAWHVDEYMSQYELSRQLRVYTLACQAMAKLHPESVLGRIGATKMGAFIDTIFLKSKANENEYARSPVYQYSNDDLVNFNGIMQDYCQKISFHVEHAHYIPKEGILNGSCDGKFEGVRYRCPFWNVCKSPDHIARLLLDRDFKRIVYDPLNFNEIS
jgi:hypothetical protein